MRLRKRHAWGAVLIFLFILPIVRPQGVDLIERPTASTVQWFAEVPLLNPRLLQSNRAAEESTGQGSRALEREIARLWNHVLHVRSRLQQAGALGKALQAGGLDRLPKAVLCRVLRAHDASASRRSILIDRGQTDGLRPGLPVVVGGVYLGRVAVAFSHTARVRLVTDRESRMEVFVRTSRGKGLRGYARRSGTKDGQDVLAIEFVRRHDNAGEIRLGASVFTANFHELVPSHLLVGRIAAVEDPDMDSMPTLIMAPEFDLDVTTEVIVLRTDELLQRHTSPLQRIERASPVRAPGRGGGAPDTGAAPAVPAWVTDADR